VTAQLKRVVNQGWANGGAWNLCLECGGTHIVVMKEVIAVVNGTFTQFSVGMKEE
jgi:hypothetical protein